MSLRLALFGKDVSRSPSGKIHTFILGEYGEKCTYDIRSVSSLSKRKICFYDGCNITMPYKETVLPFLDGLDERAKRIGAVNTVALKEGKLIGYNTDGTGFMTALDFWGTDVSKKTVLLVGLGGAGKSVALSLKERGADVFCVRKNQEKLASDCQKFGLKRYEGERTDFVINATGQALQKRYTATELMIDLRYSDELFSEYGSEKKVLSGKEMLFFQAYYADMIFLNRTASEEESVLLYKKFLTGGGRI